jgi:hypothetical protein
MAIETIKTDVSVKYTKFGNPQSDNTVQARDSFIYMGAAKIRIVGAPRSDIFEFS